MKEGFQDDLARRFRAARIELKMSQKTAGKLFGVGQKQISDYESANPPPAPEMVHEMERRAFERQVVLLENEQLSPLNIHRLFIPPHLWSLLQVVEHLSQRQAMDLLDEDGRLESALKSILEGLLRSEKETNSA